MQAMINIVVNSGLLPTKGLTLPFISYGGSSMIIMTIALTFIFRIDYEFVYLHFETSERRYDLNEQR